jgi:serine/threonine protein kinase
MQLFLEKAMPTDERLYPLLDRWVAEADFGRLLPAAELCRDCLDLLPEAERSIAVLHRFHLLAQPVASTSVEVQAQMETTSGERVRDLPSAPLPDAGVSFGRYQILAQLGGGGMGIVCKARDTQLDRDIALKFMRPDVAAKPSTRERFLHEARALAAVRHDHVVEIYDQGEIDGICFVVMPLLAGGSLQTRLERQSPLPPAEVLRIGLELTDGLAAVHAKGLIHRDLKPSNVWLEAPHGCVKLLDFGLACDPSNGDALTCPGAVVGTPSYMSPEQANGLDVDVRSDLFSLGSVLYRAATGRAAFAASSLTATLNAVAEKDPPAARIVNPAVPAALSDLIECLHRKKPADRPASAAEVLQQLRTLAALGETPTTDYKPPAAAMGLSTGERQRGWSNRVRLAVAGALGLLLVLGIVLYPRLRNRSDEVLAPGDPSPARSGPAEPLRVRALDVVHLASFDERRTRPRRLLGKESFGASADDDIKVSARLSRPAYCYLIVFRPDGKDEILYPQGAQVASELTDEPRYPSRDRSKVYGLTDGTGLWVIALVASDSPLPAYAEWRQQHPVGPWVHSDGELDVVWLDDGQWLEAMTPRGLRSRGGRGEKEAAGTAPIVRVVDWLKAETGGTVSAVGFTAVAKK